MSFSTNRPLASVRLAWRPERTSPPHPGQKSQTRKSTRCKGTRQRHSQKTRNHGCIRRSVASCQRRSIEGGMRRYSDPWPNADSHWSGYRPVPPSAPEIRMRPGSTAQAANQGNPTRQSSLREYRLPAAARPFSSMKPPGRSASARPNESHRPINRTDCAVRQRQNCAYLVG